MPKDRRVGSLTFDRSRVSPYPCSSRDAKQCQHENPLGLGFASPDYVKELEDVRCPICMEHPHNAVLLRCSSFEKGCRPFMCNTSYRHSNCLDQFCKSLVSSPSTAALQEIPLGNVTSSRWRDPLPFYDQTEAGSDLQPKLLCPLCRGEIYGWSVVEPAREFMNSKSRSCSSATCDFSGTYSELRKHARSDHPLVRPTEVDLERQRDWTSLERERDYEDMLSSIQPVARDESNGESISSLFHTLLSLHLAYLRLALEVISDSINMEQVQFRRRSGSRRWFRYDLEYDHGARERISSVSDRAFLGHHNNPSPVERFRGRNHSSQGMLQWRHRSSPSERFLRGRRRSLQANRTHRGRLRWRAQRWSTFDNGQ
ncbi:uncharacterized protein LOC111274463 [Durio zibethinus]|uniref:Uncharacterized protein LOC111274463 n=1 Tax=Durio zibethinus TaxID=66656 RepID=A0A6P5WFM8_DURZI|nr:uncharacterized protein LOC111274463 [Durio zibethinus]XP_022714860.1 uncharacterized protein LOC111274463 [Durio zibethinus]